ncbi:RIP metalloprotease RseP [Parasulfitobacter algicola]|uniref:Zinc metalloprotease n=1 Tax=Parasulfitobacter algicola TaxID=2614809 RepID=A0ABX2ITP6_9RHOB|nr:RIP metalloprotease RseP [Sulfitobacter algicola]NSX55376.1 RIP metalloprotease RseP [Sulfitobacter algicola]
MDITSFAAGFGGVTYMILFLIIALSIIVAIHEYGHYIVGRWCGIHAEVFSIGFGPVIYSRRDKRGTQWQIAILPLGGFVKFLGDADAASGKDGERVASLSAAEQRRTMHGAPLWARSATVVAGPVFNFIFSIAIFTGLILYQGQPTEDFVIEDFLPLPDVYTQELQPGDVVVAINGQEIGADLGAVLANLPSAREIDYGIIRDGEAITVTAPHLMPPVVHGLTPRLPAMDIDMKIGDVITAVDGAPVYTFEDFRQIVVNSEGKPLKLDVWRDGEQMDFVLVPRKIDYPLEDGTFEKRYLIGMTSGLFIERQAENVGFFTAVWYGVENTFVIMSSSVNALWNIITGAISTCNLSGPVGIAEMSSGMASQGTMSFIQFIAVLSTAIGFINLFPIPVLDGGHLVFHAYEAVRGKPPNDQALKYMMIAGLTIMLSFMVFALTNDIFCP